MLATFLTLACTASTWVVDASGSGDFTDLQAAVDAAQDGDVLLVQAGTYGAFTMSKALTVLGPAAGPRPLVLGHSHVLGAQRFAFGGLELERLTVEDVPGHGEIDACTIHSPTQWGVGIFDCDRIQVERSTVEADTTYYSLGQGAALYVERSGVTVVASTLIGPDSAAGEAEYTNGGDGLFALDSEVRVVNSDALGGYGGSYQGLFSFCEGGGSAFHADGGSMALQGIGHLAAGNLGGSGCSHGSSIVAGSGAQVVQQGYELPDGLKQLDGGSIVASTWTPSMTLVGKDLPGTTRRLLVSASHSQPVFVIGSLGSSAFEVPGFEGLVGIDLSSIVYLGETLGQKIIAPSTVPFHLPPSFAGIEGTVLHLQAVAPLTPGVYDPSAGALANPVTLLVRF